MKVPRAMELTSLKLLSGQGKEEWELLSLGSRVSILKTENIIQIGGTTSVNESSAIELHIESWLKTEILCDVYFAVIKKL